MEDFDMLPVNTGLTSSQENFPQNMALEHFPGNIKGENVISTSMRQHEKQNAELLNAKHCGNFSIGPDYNESFEMVMEIIDSDTSYKPKNTVCASQCIDIHRPYDDPYIPVTGLGGIKLNHGSLMTSKDIIDENGDIDLKKKTDVQKKLQVEEEQMESKGKDNFNMENQMHLHVANTFSLQNSVCANTNDTSQENYSISLNNTSYVNLREMKGANSNDKKVEDELDDLQSLLSWLNEGNFPFSNSISVDGQSKVFDCQSQGFDDHRNVFHGQRNTFDDQSKAFDGKNTRVDYDQVNTLNGSCNTCYGQSKAFDGFCKCKSLNDQRKIFGGLCYSSNGQSKAFGSKNNTFDVRRKTFNDHSNDLVGQNDSICVHAFDGQNQSFDTQNSGLNGESNAFNGQNDTFHVQNSGLNGESNAFNGQNQAFHVQNSGLNGESNAFNGQNQAFHVQNSCLNGESNAFDGNRRINNGQSNVSDCCISAGGKISPAEVCYSINKTDSQPTVIPVIKLSSLLAAKKNGSLEGVLLFTTSESDDSMRSFADTNAYPKKLAEPAGFGYPGYKSNGLAINLNLEKRNAKANFLQNQQFKMVQGSNSILKSEAPLEMSTYTYDDNNSSVNDNDIHRPVQHYTAAESCSGYGAIHDTFSVNTTCQSQITSSHTSGTMLSTESDVASLSENQNTSFPQNPMDSIMEEPRDANHCKIKRDLQLKIKQKITNSQVYELYSRHHPYQNDQHLLPNLPEFEN
ncbi:uncharacterized protein LOC132758594 [Ruditapes philippinarum]|uniref:uncharacterized protein LOC132758594 n=1 Tax=Ruditapes philippinarum TaxID=129788 RepID=UPI00295C011E|nr:uncharacterized protein LOC132758594 [Ruditapes philippinarum]XP_060606268.1 uncharacterized protein LOC132758594 [Ruditapes philippinarum]XP_060606269.1 uncharacterized protein LOC132758594 [Ruditapes philippinarum]